ncbi:MAG: response regulator [Planctomycetota bacterium]|jgi:DNA-binding NtrC family response regulator
MPNTVLLVDDEPMVYQAMRRALHREPYELLYAESGAQALDILTERDVDVVVADENMPNMQGTALLARIRQQWPDIVRMMLTGDARIETVVAAVNRGEIFRFFVKPANDAELVVSLRDAIKMRSLKFEAARLLTTVKRQGEQLRAVSTPVADEDPPPINLEDMPRRGKPAATDPSLEEKAPNSVIELNSRDLPDDVDGLLDEIRTQLEKLDL